MALVSYVADESLRGNLPFPRCILFFTFIFIALNPAARAREEELLYVLRKLLALRLWPGTLWAALSDTPSKYYIEQPGLFSCCSVFVFALRNDVALDQSLPPSTLIADAIKRSTKAHLFHFYPILCEIVSIPRKPPTAWIVPRPLSSSREGSNEEPSSSATAVELDTRILAKDCLKEVGRELGVSR